MSNLPGQDDDTSSLSSTSSVSSTGSIGKEQKDALGPSEAVRPPEEAEGHEEEVAGWLERLERGEDIHLPQPVVDDQTGQVLVTPASAADPQIVLPVSEEVMTRGLHVQVWESLRWLAEWSWRIFKMFPRRVVYGN